MKDSLRFRRSAKHFSEDHGCNSYGFKSYDIVYFDNFLIFSNTIEEHNHRLRMVFDRIREANFKLNLEKCTFAANEMSHLGHILSSSRVLPDASKVKAIKTVLLPRNVRYAKSFLELAGYYRSFINNFEALSKP
jgi:hypothetical protein